MRLIDADNISEIKNDALKTVIEDQPTVEAIPVEWIEKYAHDFINRLLNRYLKSTLTEMIDCWRKEQKG